jgi:hypothetical protein
MPRRINKGLKDKKVRTKAGGAARHLALSDVRAHELVATCLSVSLRVRAH